jgi:hypothetical protein
MSIDILERLGAGASHRPKIRNPGNLRLARSPTRLDLAKGSLALPLVLETFGLGCLIGAIAGIVPLVMYLHD